PAHRELAAFADAVREGRAREAAAASAASGEQSAAAAPAQSAASGEPAQAAAGATSQLAALAQVAGDAGRGSDLAGGMGGSEVAAGEDAELQRQLVAAA